MYQSFPHYYRRIFIFVSAFIFISIQAKGQSEKSLLDLINTESQVKHDSIYYELFKLNSTSNTQNALYYSQRAYQLSSRYKHSLLKINISYDLATLYDGNNQPDSSITYFHKAIRESSHHKLNDWLIYLYNNLGQLHRRLDVYDSALHYFMLSYNLANENEASKAMAIATYNIGVVYSNLENHKDAILHFKEAIDIKRHNGITQGINLNLINLARVLNIQGLHKEATEQLKQVESNCKNGCDDSILADLYYQFGYSNVLKSKPEEAYEFFTKALALSRKNNIDQTIANSLFQLSCLEYNRAAYSESLKLLREAEAIAVKTSHRRLLRDIDLAYSKLYTSMGVQNKGLYYKERYHQLKDSIFNENVANHISDIRLSEQGKKSAAIIEQKETALSTSYILIGMLTVIALLTLAVVFLVARALASSRKHRQFMELHILQTLDYREYSENKLFSTHMEFTSLLSRVTNFLSTPVATLMTLANGIKSNNAASTGLIEATDKMIQACANILIVLKNMNDLILYKNHKVVVEEIDVSTLAEEVNEEFKEIKKFILLQITIDPLANRTIKSDKEIIKAAIKHAINYFGHVLTDSPIIELIFSQQSDDILRIAIKHNSTSNISLPFTSQFNHLTVMVTSGKIGGDFRVIQFEDHTLFEIFIPVDFSALINKISRHNIS